MGNMRRRNPFPTVDILIERDGAVMLIRRKNPPHGWAIPGGFVDWGESLEDAARREAREETGVDVSLIRQFHTYSRPDRDPRFHTISTVYWATATGNPVAADDALEARFFPEEALPSPLAFDHAEILADFFAWRRSGSP